MDKPCTLIQRQMGELFQCAEVGRFIRIRTPFLYPDGDYIDLFWKEAGDVATLTDLGETIRWLKMQTITPRRSPKQNQMIEDIRRQLENLSETARWSEPEEFVRHLEAA